MVQTRAQRQKKADKEPLLQLWKTPSNSYSDIKSIVLLVILYLLQGIPLGLALGSVPYLLKSKLNYSDMALFSLSAYPYSLKLLWSPVVDSIYSKAFGRRKSWIIPLQFLLGTCLIVVGSQVDTILAQQEIPVAFIAGIFTLIVLLCATQDIAVDGWAISLLTDNNKTFASTAQTIGLQTGYFLSFTVFLAFNSAEFANRYLRSTPYPVGIISLGGYLQFWGVMFLLCNMALLILKPLDPVEQEESIMETYQTIWNICKLPHMQKFIAVMLIAKIGFQANEAVTGLKLLELGFNKEYLALSVLIDFPLQMIFGYYAAKWSSGPKPLHPWTIAFYFRLLAALGGMLVVYNFPKNGVNSFYFILVMLVTVLTSFMNTIQFVGMGSFFTKISDPAIGGTYMTLLNTVSNLGGTWPKYFVLLAVDYFTDAPCIGKDLALSNEFKCSDEMSRTLCKDSGGTCDYISDGYYVVNTVCLVFGIISLIFYIKPTIDKLQVLKNTDWRISLEQLNKRK